MKIGAEGWGVHGARSASNPAAGRLLLPTGACLMWWWAQPVSVEPSGWSTELPSFYWPFMVALTTVPDVVAGVVEVRLLRRRHLAFGIEFRAVGGIARPCRVHVDGAAR